MAKKVAKKKTTTKTKKATAKKSVTKKAAAKKAAKKTTAKKTSTKKTASKKAASKKTSSKKSTKKTATKKAVSKKTSNKKASPSKKPGSKKTKRTGVVASVVNKVMGKSKSTKSSTPKSSKQTKTMAPETKSPKKVSKKAAAKSAKKPKALYQPNVKPYRERKGEDYMNAEHIKHFINILNDWKRELMEEVDRTVHHMKDESQNLPDPNDRASQEEEFSLELRTRDRERKLIRKIDKTLVAIQNDDYGYCEDCGIEIGVRRLEVRPTATQCIDCKTLAELKEKQTTI